MAGQTDFLKLYQELGLTPGCSIDALTQAYRRRVKELHPDRRADAVDAAADERLHALLTLYDAAQQFQRRHGRLPGAPQLAATAMRAAPDKIANGAQARSSGALWLVPAIALAAALAWFLLEPEPAPPSEARAAAPLDTDSAAQKLPQELVLGMDPDSVRDIQGQPPLDLGERWEYGPSYVRFEHRKLVDWYSSPLRPLRTATQRPPTNAAPTRR